MTFIVLRLYTLNHILIDMNEIIVFIKKKPHFPNLRHKIKKMEPNQIKLELMLVQLLSCSGCQKIRPSASLTLLPLSLFTKSRKLPQPLNRLV